MQSTQKTKIKNCISQLVRTTYMAKSLTLISVIVAIVFVTSSIAIAKEVIDKNKVFNDCLAKIPDHCASLSEEGFGRSKDCCRQLTDMGRDCYSSVIAYAQEYTHVEVNDPWKLWRTCESLAVSVHSTPSV
ncbi:hypothetical protein Droror1_Dr00013394 [Drosera rotundifolia]